MLHALKARAWSAGFELTETGVAEGPAKARTVMEEPRATLHCIPPGTESQKAACWVAGRPRLLPMTGAVSKQLSNGAGTAVETEPKVVPNEPSVTRRRLWYASPSPAPCWPTKTWQ